jgi:hypothetical protein
MSSGSANVDNRARVSALLPRCEELSGHFPQRDIPCVKRIVFSTDVFFMANHEIVRLERACPMQLISGSAGGSRWSRTSALQSPSSSSLSNDDIVLHPGHNQRRSDVVIANGSEA